MTSKRPAVVLMGHGSLLAGSGQAMQQVAAQLQTQGVAPLVKAAFLNYSRPTLAETVTVCQQEGATSVLVVPYFLIAGSYVTQDLPETIRAVAVNHPGLRFQVADALGAHPALAGLAQKRLAAVEPTPYDCCEMREARGRIQRTTAQPAARSPQRREETTGLLFVAHGTPLEQANAPIYRILDQVQVQAGYGPALVGYLDCNQPDIPAAFAQLVALGVKHIAVLPYFLQLGRHVRQDLPALFAQAQLRYPQVDIRTAEHLGYDPLLATAIADRIAENLPD